MDRQARSPGKLILSGEHSVVHGCPALAMAVNREVRVRLQPLPDPLLRIHLPNRQPCSYPLEELPLKLKQAQAEHSVTAGPFFNQPEDLLALCAGMLPPKTGVELLFESDLPIGAGLGSSAAFILSLLKVLQPTISGHSLQKLAVEGEHFQHGRSSGLDVSVSLNGGLQLFQSGSLEAVSATTLPDFRIYNSGKPKSATGECVATSTLEFQKNKELLPEFTRITQSLVEAIKTQNHDLWEYGLRENHRSLCKVGVVPASLQKIISELEAKGFSAKVCGAGSVKGDAAGMVLISGHGPHPVPSFWQTLDLQLSPSGTRTF